MVFQPFPKNRHWRRCRDVCGRVFHRPEKLDRRWLKNGCDKWWRLSGVDTLMGLDGIRPQHMAKLSGVGICIPEQTASTWCALSPSATAAVAWCSRISTQKTEAEQQNSLPTSFAWSDERGCQPALRYHSPASAGWETTPVTVGRSVVLNLMNAPQLIHRIAKQAVSLWHVTSSTHRRRRRFRGCIQRKLAWLDWCRLGLVTEVADEASTGCRPENLGLRSIQLEPVGAHPPDHIITACRDAVLKLQHCRRTTDPIDLGVVSIQMRAYIMALMSSSMSAMYDKNRIGPRTDPCGTPHRVSAGDEGEEPVRTNWWWPTR